ncbi:carboxymuconolactone decarboxylase family protein [Streptomyces sp. TLI_105]|uniref:carboxymuconolactone decarboxylase family protein n=1 Tax=Streptomyces sp. TLI_105 TaxID=1881019 RepID=UPI00089528D5|nr:carboxymuconolactone decarboxylase family protein [Streptomyces sp. TLI_105]SED07617.1 alkylhydroperoxidase AhpD family core domain-containing protein [Streptomyces sp. TLI_105]
MKVAATSRLSNPVRLVPELGAVAGALYKATGNGAVPKTTIDLLQLRAGQIVGNTYLTVMHTESLRKDGIPEERITAVASWQDAPCFSEEEAVALALVEAVLRPAAPGAERVPDELYAKAAELYDEKGLATLALAIGQVNFFIPLALIGKPLPGVKPSEQWT